MKTFCVKNRKMALKSMKKALGLSVLPAWDPARAENLIKPVENCGFGEPTSGRVAGLSGPAGRSNCQLAVYFILVHLFYSSLD